MTAADALAVNKQRPPLRPPKRYRGAAFQGGMTASNALAVNKQRPPLKPPLNRAAAFQSGMTAANDGAGALAVG